MENLITKPLCICCLATLLTASAGCWREVHYDSDKPMIATPVFNDRTVAEVDPQLRETNSDNLPEAEQSPDEVTADELFGSPDEGNPAEASTVDPPTEVAPGEVASAGPREPSATTPDLAVELPSEPEAAEPSAPAESMPTEDVPPAETDADDPPSADTVDVMRPSKTALAVWRMSSRWSFAAAIYAKGQPEDRYRESLDQATYAAELVGAELPSFPASEGIALESAVIGYLLSSGPSDVVDKLGADFAPEYEALAELAIRTNALLLVYTPKSQQLDPLISAIRQSAEKSGLPAELWAELIEMLELRGPFAEVKQRVLAFHTEVGDYLAGAE
jgi:hypothetical protein